VESKAEEFICRSLRTILDGVSDGASVEDFDQLKDVLAGLEYFIPEVLSEIHPEWHNESLDGVLPLHVQKSGERELELFGLCIIISDQTLIPVHLRLEISPISEQVSYFELKLGERKDDEMIMLPYESQSHVRKRLYALIGKEETLNWAYKVSFGQK
jgi:hypothetical protein